MAAGEGGADSLPPPSPSLPGPLPGPERALEEAVASGSLSLAGRRLRHFPGGAARRWDLSDTTQAGCLNVTGLTLTRDSGGTMGGLGILSKGMRFTQLAVPGRPPSDEQHKS